MAAAVRRGLQERRRRKTISTAVPAESVTIRAARQIQVMTGGSRLAVTQGRRTVRIRPAVAALGLAMARAAAAELAVTSLREAAAVAVARLVTERKRSR